MFIKKDPDKTQLERISYYEDLFERTGEALAQFDNALAELIRTRPVIEELKAYYSGEEWKQDFEADEKGRIPAEMKRGVLSEDGLYDLLEEYDRRMNLLKGPDND